MHAEVGDWIVVEALHLDGPRRKGQIVRLQHPDGSPPYVVHWVEDDRETVFFPGPECHLAPAAGRRFADAGPARERGQGGE